jgi:hypothetical protein
VGAGRQEAEHGDSAHEVIGDWRSSASQVAA